VISGLNNFSPDLVQKVASAGAQGGASVIDIACDPALVRLAKAVADIPVRSPCCMYYVSPCIRQSCAYITVQICVSAIDPEKFVAAVEAGADMLELGNYDSYVCYFPHAQTILELIELCIGFMRKACASLQKM
jgi:hypothetical protein